MQKWKDSLNFSGIFQEAISNRIEKKEEYENFKQQTKEDFDMDKTIEKLRKQRGEYRKQGFEAGQKDGYERAKNLDYDDIQYVLQYETLSDRLMKLDDRDFPNPCEDEVFGEYFTEIIKQQMGDNLSTWDNAGDLPDEYIVQFEAGFISGIKDFWNEIKDKL